MWIFKPYIAHAFGQVYNLPVPLWLFIYGGAAAVVLSFIVVGFFVDVSKNPQAHASKRLAAPPKGLVRLAQLLSLALTLFVIVSGVIGRQDSLTNFSVTFFWVIFLVGFTFITAVFGDIWRYINPVRTVVELLEKAGISVTPYFSYPRWLSYYPALVTYLGLIWLELLSAGLGIIPANLAKLLLCYLIINLTGVMLFGKKSWFRYGDFFSVFFGLVARLAPFEYKAGGIYFRKPFIGLLDNTERSLSLLLFVLFMLASTAFDGFRETTAFSTVYYALRALPLLSHLPYQVMITLMLLLAPLTFLAVYWLFMIFMRILVRSPLTTKELALKFSFTLIPIAVAYNVAHYYSLLVIQGQAIISLLSDPFGFGWNLLHTAGHRINAGVLNAGTVWYSQVALIVIGHIAAVYLAHLVAIDTFHTPKKAILSQYPMLLLMIVYTMTSLWIIAQPLTRG